MCLLRARSSPSSRPGQRTFNHRGPFLHTDPILSLARDWVSAWLFLEVPILARSRCPPR